MSLLTPLSKAIPIKDATNTTATCPSGYQQVGVVNDLGVLCCPNGYHQASPDSSLCLKNGLPIIAYIGIAIGVIGLIAICTVFFILRRRRLRRMQNIPIAQYNEKYNPSSFNNTSYQPQTYQQNYQYQTQNQYQSQPSYYVPQTENSYSHPAY